MTSSVSTGAVPPPASSPATAARRVLRYARFEAATLLRNGEQLLLTVVIPVVLLVGLSVTSVVALGSVPAGSARVDTALPAVLAVAVLSSAFTAQAIAVGFDRRSGLLTHLGTTPLGRSGLVMGRGGAVLVVVALQCVLLVAIAFALGWRAPSTAAAAVPLILLGVAAFSGLALLLAGTVRAEATLAAANLVFLLLLVAGGTVIAPDQWPPAAAAVIELLPSAALADGLRSCLRDGLAPSVKDWLVLGAWTAAGTAAAVRWFRWS